jgi:predicted nuclease of predicted toxin-antitoxin system
MKVLVDMNLSPGWVSFLIDRGFEAVHWSEVGEGNASDSELMKWAAERGYIVLTADLDFGAILAATQRRQPSVVQLRNDILTPHAVGAVLVVAIQQTRQELLDGALVSVDAARARLRILTLTNEA